MPSTMVQVPILMSPGQKRRLAQKAKAANLTMAELLREGGERYVPADDPALTRCLVSVMAPCLFLLIGRRGKLGPFQELAQQPTEAIVEHLHEFAMGGLMAIRKTSVQGFTKTS